MLRNKEQVPIVGKNPKRKGRSKPKKRRGRGKPHRKSSRAKIAKAMGQLAASITTNLMKGRDPMVANPTRTAEYVWSNCSDNIVRRAQSTDRLTSSIATDLMRGVGPAPTVPFMAARTIRGAVQEYEEDDRLLMESHQWLNAHQVENTERAYRTYDKQFDTHCQEEKVTRFPAKPATVVTFVKKLVDKDLSISTVGVALSAIAAEYKPYDEFVSPTHSGLVRMAREVVNREAKPAGPGKLPIPIEYLVGFATVCLNNKLEGSLEVFLMIIMMAAFMRESEAATLEEADIWLEHIEKEEVLFVKVETSKTDKERRGHTIVVGKAEHHPTICPVDRFKIAVARRPESKKFFCRPNGKALYAAEPNKILKKLLLSRPDVDASLYGSHSLRKEGCTAAAAAGVELTLLKRHGNWKSDAVFTYIKNSMKERLSVSKSFI
jgi:hypothetical protein